MSPGYSSPLNGTSCSSAAPNVRATSSALLTSVIPCSRNVVGCQAGSPSTAVSFARISFAAIHMKRGDSRSCSRQPAGAHELAPHDRVGERPADAGAGAVLIADRIPVLAQVDPLGRVDGLQVPGRLGGLRRVVLLARRGRRDVEDVAGALRLP